MIKALTFLGTLGKPIMVLCLGCVVPPGTLPGQSMAKPKENTSLVSQGPIRKPSQTVRFSWPNKYFYHNAPVIINDRLLGASREGLFACLSIETGKVVWSAKDYFSQENLQEPLIANGLIFLMGPQGVLQVRCAEDGRIQQSFNGFDVNVRPIASREGNLFCFDNNKHCLIHYDMKKRQKEWEVPFSRDSFIPGSSSIAVDSTVLVITIEDRDSQGRIVGRRLCGLKRNNGKLLWCYTQTRVWKEPISLGEGCAFFIAEHSSKEAEEKGKKAHDSPPVNPEIVAVNICTGEVCWRSSEVSEAPSFKSPVIQDGIVYFDDAYCILRAIRWNDKKVLWKSRGDCGAGDILGSSGLALDGDVVYWSPGVMDYGILKENGAILWKNENEWRLSRPVLYKGKMWFAIEDGVIAFY